MAFNFRNEQLFFEYCSSNCVLKNYNLNPDDIIFAGFSKGHNKGLRYQNKLLLERKAIDWDSTHDFGVKLIRENIVKEGKILEILSKLNHLNILPIRQFCNCTVEMNFINGCLLNTKKEHWIIGPLSYTKDYLDYCSRDNVIDIIHSVGFALKLLHDNGVCHTDPADHNVMVQEINGQSIPVLIDLIGAMPFTKELERLDSYVFLNHLIIPLIERKNINIHKDVKKYQLQLNDTGMLEFLESIKNLIRS